MVCTASTGDWKNRIADLESRVSIQTKDIQANIEAIATLENQKLDLMQGNIQIPLIIIEALAARRFDYFIYFKLSCFCSCFNLKQEFVDAPQSTLVAGMENISAPGDPNEKWNLFCMSAAVI